MLFYGIAGLVILIDQLAKILVRLYIPVGDELWYYSIHLSHYENSGMAGSMFQGYARWFGIVAILFVAIVLYYRRAEEYRGRWTDVITGFLVGGAIGNGIDRLVFGQVTDFIVSHSGRGILNIADVAINIGALLLVVYVAVQFVRNKICAYVGH